MLRFAAFSVLAIVFTLGVSWGDVTHAQYLDPTGNLQASVVAPSLPVGGETTVICDVTDVAGRPVVGANCTFSVVSEPAGSDVAVGSKTITKITDGSGRATTQLRNITVPGPIVISVTSGTMASNVIVQVAGSVAPPVAAPVILPPSTGDGGLR